MKIKDMQVDGFGVWKNLSVDDLTEEMTVFYGRNEAGKTTLMQFVRSVLYGYDEERRKRYIPPVYGGTAGGSLLVESNQGDVEVTRHVDPSRAHAEEGNLEITWPDGKTAGRSHLNLLTAKVDEPTFNNVFALGLREIQELSMLNNTDAAEHLYKLTSGLDRVSLVDVMKDLRVRRESIWTSEVGRPSNISDHLTKQKKLRREIDELTANARRWSKVALKSTEIEDQLDRINERIETLERESRIVELAIQIRERWNARRLIDDQIKSIGALPDEREISIPSLDEVNREIAELNGKMDQNRRLREEISGEARALPINRMLWKNQSRIEALQEHEPWIQSLERQIAKKRNRLERVNGQLEGEVDSLASQFKSNRNSEVPEFGRSVIESLRSVARELKDEKDKLAAALNEREMAETELLHTSEELQQELVNRGCDRLIDSLDDSGKLVHRLRKRVEIEEQVETLETERQDLDHDIEQMMRDQIMSPRRIFWLGIVVVFGVVLLLGGVVFNLSIFADMEWLCAILGVACLLFAGGLKLTWDQNQRDELEGFQHQLDVVRQQLKRAYHERDELDRDLPTGISHHGSKLKDAETELLRLQDLVPLESKVKTLKKILDESGDKVSACEEGVASALNRWKTKLRLMNLPEDLSPNAVRDIAVRAEKISSINHKLRDYEEDLQAQKSELVTIASRIRNIVTEVGIEPGSKKPRPQLEQLTDALATERKLVDKRKDLADEYKRLRSKHAKQERQLEVLLGTKSRMLSKVGADSEEMYREFAMKHEQVKQLLVKRESLSEQIAAAISGQITESDIAEALETGSASALEKRWENIQHQNDENQTKKSELHQLRGEYSQEMKMLAEDKRLDEARLELNMIEQQIQRSIETWQTTAATCLILESIRDNYEADRQPETLKAASDYLSQLTGGKYNRIWTRLTENCLLVDNAEGESLAVEVLSRGTREAVYLGLRMALVAAYARRGAMLPLVLDDVLVNFDKTRMERAAETLRDFSERGYQVMMFTCHDHIRELFLDLNVEVRDLPSHLEIHETGAHVPPARRNPPEPVFVEPEPVYEPPRIEEPVYAEPPKPEPPPLHSRDPRPTMYVRQNELNDLERELRDELGAIPGELKDDHRTTEELYKPPIDHLSGRMNGGESPSDLTMEEVNDLLDETAIPSQSYYDQDNWDVQGAA